VLNRNPTQVGYDFYLPKILSGELNANNIIPTLIAGQPQGQIKKLLQITPFKTLVLHNPLPFKPALMERQHPHFLLDLKKPPSRFLRILVDPYKILEIPK
jgi:hypothetical protein